MRRCASCSSKASARRPPSRATQGAADQANLRYKGGIVTYLEVVTTENAALQARLSAVDIEIRRANSTVLLIKALGGDWQPPQAP